MATVITSPQKKTKPCKHLTNKRDVVRDKSNKCQHSLTASPANPSWCVNGSGEGPSSCSTLATSSCDTSSATARSSEIWLGMVMCITQNGEVCTVGIPTCLSCEEAPRWMSMIWFSYNTLKSVDEQISTMETCGLCAEQHLLQHCFQLSGWRITTLLSLRYVLTRDRVNVW